MSHAYRAVGWNPQKKRYDLAILLGVLTYLGAFVGVGAALEPGATAESLMIRGAGTLALVLLHVILCIGPLCRFDTRFLPLLYNRRHLGVVMFVLALAHGGLATLLYHTASAVNPIVSVLAGGGGWSSLADFPFQPLGFAALLILALMATTSHDFWLAQLTPPVWKALHMLVYAAYALVIAHVALGVLAAEASPVLAGMLGVGVLTVGALHLAAATRESRTDARLQRATRPAGDAPGAPGLDATGSVTAGMVDVAALAELVEGEGHAALVAGERVAVFLHDGKVSAVSGVCQHQNGPLAEGRVIDGCITCPWHGYQYEPETGCSPPPFDERIPTFRVAVRGGRVFVASVPLPAGTRVEPARMPA